MTSWLADRQTDLVDPESELEFEFAGNAPSADASQSVTQPTQQLTPSATPTVAPSDLPIAAGMNGRLNKTADTCYCWWVGASLSMLGKATLFDHSALRRYLLQLTQHPYMGGFCKFPDDKYADIYHSFLGLAALSVASTPEQRIQDNIKEWDVEMCVSKDVRRRLRND